MNLDSKIEAILFYKGEPVSIKKLSDILGNSREEIEHALADLEKNLEGRGLNLIFHDDQVVLGTVPEASSIISTILKEELNRELGKAGLETLTIVMYKGPISKKEIDYIRGVNSNYILRNLLVRGLVEKAEKSKDRSTYYQPTVELLTYLNLKRVEEMPEYQTMRAQMEKLKSSEEKND